MRVVLIVLFFIGLFYLLIPGPKSITDFPALPKSVKSTEEGDTVQIPNVSAYFSDWWRADVTSFYRSQFQKANCPDVPWKIINPMCYILPVRINRPPEEAYQFIRDQQQSSYLEEYTYPLRDALFVNGYEPFDKMGKPFQPSSTNLVVNGEFFNSKATLRFYPSSRASRVFIYTGMWLAAISLYMVGRKVVKKG